jgi:hypothetical protein
MTDFESLAPLGWLILAVGIGVILITVVPRKDQVRSPTRRLAGVLSGLVFIFLAAVVLVPYSSAVVPKALVAAAIVSGGTSWYLGRHAKKMDRIARRK